MNAIPDAFTGNNEDLRESIKTQVERPEDTLPPYPPVPEGYDRWEDRGMGWDNGGREAKYAIIIDGNWVIQSGGYPSAVKDRHYIEAVKDPKTVREWLETLPDGYRERALKNMEWMYADKQVRNLAEAVYKLPWACSPEGHCFWSNVRKHCREGTPLPELPEDPTPQEAETEIPATGCPLVKVGDIWVRPEEVVMVHPIPAGTMIMLREQQDGIVSLPPDEVIAILFPKKP